MSLSSTRAPALHGSRRAFLRTLLQGSVGLPWLETFAPRIASAQSGMPKRFVVMFSPNGTVYDAWLPSMVAGKLQLSEVLAPLAGHEQDLVVIAGVDQKGAGGDGHQNGMGGMLTGAPLLPGRFAGVGAPPAGWAAGPSVDQRIAEVLGRGVPYRSLELGVQVRQADNWGRMIYRARNQPLPPREDPASVFDDLFGVALLDPGQRAERQARKQSILDHVTAELRRLSAEVSAADRQRLEAHLTYLRAVEVRAQEQSRATLACTLPARPPEARGGDAVFARVGELQIDLLVLALACGQTRVASLQWSRSVSQVVFGWLGIQDSHHALSHRPDSDVLAQAQLRLINRWYAERFATLISKLKAYPEGSATLFDQCLLLWCNELGKGNNHSRNDAPYVLAGSAGGALETGRLLQYSGEVPHNDLLVSLLNIMGLEDRSFGQADWCTGPLSGVI